MLTYIDLCNPPLFIITIRIIKGHNSRLISLFSCLFFYVVLACDCFAALCEELHVIVDASLAGDDIWKLLWLTCFSLLAGAPWPADGDGILHLKNLFCCNLKAKLSTIC